MSVDWFPCYEQLIHKGGPEDLECKEDIVQFLRKFGRDWKIQIGKEGVCHEHEWFVAYRLEACLQAQVAEERPTKFCEVVFILV